MTHLPVFQINHNILRCQLVHDSISSIAVNSRQNDPRFVLGQERLLDDESRPRRLVRKVDDEQISQQPKDNSNDSFHDKDPPPAIESSDALHFTQPICQNIREARGQQRQQVESRETLLHFESQVPAR